LVVFLSLQLEHFRLGRITIQVELQKLIEPPDKFDARPVVSYLLRLAHSRGASDLHLSPGPEKIEVLLRYDGVLRHEFDIEPQVHTRLLTGIKNMAKLVSYKRSTPQDGALQIDDFDVRVATAPTVHGEHVVMRLLHQMNEPESLQALGFSEAEETAMVELADLPQGLILATGPAGSGKTTTLLSLMSRLVSLRKARLRNDAAYRCSVVTLEDPVECVVPGFHQTSIRVAQGMTFAEGLRSILRQDPEIILVGEIRDKETARAVVQAGLTGHLVFSTVHARDSAGVVPRMLELGVESYQLSAALAGVVYQRLLRVLCAKCKRQVDQHWEPVGCDSCVGSGYQGRVGVPEILKIDEEFREMILRKARLSEMREHAISTGTVSLRESALLRVRDGVTNLAELERVVG
jgi:type II secretory ATPase GspE/PulE/Tfp pilus assembly ATPase PilB-like protein